MGNPKSKHHRDVAASVAAPAALIPVLPRLFEGVESLGAMPGAVVRMVRGAGAGAEWRYIDMGCGKGSVSIAIAREYSGARVTGVDAFAPFIAAAQVGAVEAGVSRRCTFRVGDVAAMERSRSRYDAAIMLNLFECGRAARLLRRLVRPGGVYILDDAFRSPDAPARFASAPTRGECREMIEGTGDCIEGEFVPTPFRVRRASTRLLCALQTAAPAIAREYPKLRRSLSQYISDVRASGRVLGIHLRPAIWLVRRAAR